jgi:single-strand DNA-binding protein
MLNRVMLIGHVGADPVIRYTDQSKPVANFPLATSERWTDKQSGEKKERTEWHRVSVWPEGLVEEVVRKYVKKGSKLYVEGALRTRKWVDEKGNERFSTEIVLSGFDAKMWLLDKSSTEYAERIPPVPFDDDIPF